MIAASISACVSVPLSNNSRATAWIAVMLARMSFLAATLASHSGAKRSEIGMPMALLTLIDRSIAKGVHHW
jgi:hypothetical protein